jgi:hypothetical protein
MVGSNLKLNVPWAKNDPANAPRKIIWGALDGVNRQYVQTLFDQAGGLVHIGPNPPEDPLPGLLWWRNDPDGTLYVYYDDGTSSQWVPASPSGGTAPIQQPPVIVSATPPANPLVGTLWYRLDPAMLCMWFDDGTSTQWIQL